MSHIAHGRMGHTVTLGAHQYVDVRCITARINLLLHCARTYVRPTVIKKSSSSRRVSHEHAHLRAANHNIRNAGALAVRQAVACDAEVVRHGEVHNVGVPAAEGRNDLVADAAPREVLVAGVHLCMPCTTNTQMGRKQPSSQAN